VRAKREQIATPNFRTRRRHDFVFISGPRVNPLTEEFLKFLRRPKLEDVDPVIPKLLKNARIPFEIKLRNAIVGDRQLLRALIGRQFKVRPPNDDKVSAVRLHNAEWQPEFSRHLNGLVSGNQAPVPINEY
jgi:hypothetical protein